MSIIFNLTRGAAAIAAAAAAVRLQNAQQAAPTDAGPADVFVSCDQDGQNCINWDFRWIGPAILRVLSIDEELANARRLDVFRRAEALEKDGDYHLATQAYDEAAVQFRKLGDGAVVPEEKKKFSLMERRAAIGIGRMLVARGLYDLAVTYFPIDSVEGVDCLIKTDHLDLAASRLKLIIAKEKEVINKTYVLEGLETPTEHLDTCADLYVKLGGLYEKMREPQRALGAYGSAYDIYSNRYLTIIPYSVETEDGSGCPGKVAERAIWALRQTGPASSASRNSAFALAVTEAAASIAAEQGVSEARQILDAARVRREADMPESKADIKGLAEALKGVRDGVEKAEEGVKKEGKKK